METSRRFDIVRRESEKTLFLLERLSELHLAKSRVEELLSFWPGEYQVFDLETKEVIFTASTSCPPPKEMPVSVFAE